MQSYFPECDAPVVDRLPQRFSTRARLGSFRHAARGILCLLKYEHNSRIHLVATGTVIGAGAWFHITVGEWRWLILAMGLVWMAEAFNSAIEWLCNLVSPGFNPVVKQIKDVAAGAVLLSALAAAAIGATIFWPYLTGTRLA